MTVGFVGFGEAASSIAAGLHEEGVQRIVCFDVMQDAYCVAIKSEPAWKCCFLI